MKPGWIWSGVLLGLLAMRAMFLGADPPQDMQHHFLYDEGLWTHNARQHAVFGAWVMDGHNSPLVGTALYTAVLRGVYEFFGVGMLQARAIAVLAGTATCALLLWLLRAPTSLRTAGLAMLFLGANYFMWSYNRVAFVESFQLLWITAALLCALRASQRAIWGAAAGALFFFAILAKISAILLAPILLIFWALRVPSWNPSVPRLDVRELLYFGVGAGLPAALLLIGWVVPHWSVVQASLSNEAGVTFSPSLSGLAAALGQFGLILHRPIADPNGFTTQTVVLVCIAAVLATTRLLRTPSQEWSATELLGWVWLGFGILIVALQQQQPDRRCLWLLPPLAMLTAVAMRHGGLLLPNRTDFQASRLRRWIVGLFLGWMAGFYLRPLLIPSAQQWLLSLDVVPQGETPGLGVPGVSLLVWMVFIAAGLCLAWLAARTLPTTRLRIPTWAVVTLFLVVNLARFGVYISEPQYSVRDTRNEFANWVANLELGKEVTVVGEAANTFALETSLFAFTVRTRKDYGWDMNLDGWQRFEPKILLESDVVGPVPPAPEFVTPAGERLILLHDLKYWHDCDGEPRMHSALYVTPELAARSGDFFR